LFGVLYIILFPPPVVAPEPKKSSSLTSIPFTIYFLLPLGVGCVGLISSSFLYSTGCTGFLIILKEGPSSRYHFSP
jgi:hypothetical protein